MARIFLSHSSADNAEAVALRDFLIAEGWNDLFLDLDPDRGIVAGERWERALNEAADRCEAVVFLVSKAWLASRWCLRELNLASKLNKRMFGVLIEEVPIADLPVELTATWQLVSLCGGRDHEMLRATLPDGTEAHVTFSKSGLAMLKAGLAKAGLDARYFKWPPDHDPERAPYRGMRPLEADDAGIFFGREAPLIAALDCLRGLADAPPPRLLAILGASGAGKSSFMRAGLLPRLERDDRSYVVLPVVRPEHAALSGETGFVRSLETAFGAQGLKRSRADLKAAVAGSAAAVGALVAELAESARVPMLDGAVQPPAPAVIVPIDQGEELFLGEGRDEGRAFLALLAGLLVADAARTIVLVTIRSDSYELLQTAPDLDGVRQTTLSLPPLPRGAYQTVIEGPVARLQDTKRALKVDPALTEALLADVEAGGAKDALPLLAFTLERLYTEHGGDGDLRLAEYRRSGGIKGAIEAAVERALEAAAKDPALPRDRPALLALLRRAFIPWLAGIDPETGSPRRRVARLSEIPTEARPLIAHLVAERLLTTEQAFVGEADGGGGASPSLRKVGESTVEPAHEALLRQWGALREWLDRDAAALSEIESVKRAARDWDANGRSADWLAHTGGRLENAERLLAREDLSRFLGDADRAYLQAARAAEIARRNREIDAARRLARRTLAGAAVAGALAIVAAGAAWYGFDRARVATIQGAGLSISAAPSLLDQGMVDEAMLLLLDASRYFDDGSARDELLIALHRAVETAANREVVDLPPGSTAVAVRDAFYVIASGGTDLLRFDGSGPLRTVVDGAPSDSPIELVDVLADGKTMVLVRANGEVQIGQADGSSLRVAGRFAEPDPPGKPVGDPTTTIASDGMVVRTRAYADEARRHHLQLLDARTGATYGGYHAEYGEYVPGRARAVIFEWLEGDVSEVRVSPPEITLAPHPLAPAEFDRFEFAACLQRGRSRPAPFDAKAWEFVEGVRAPITTGSEECIAWKDRFVVTTYSSGSGGVFRSDHVVDSDGTASALGERYGALAPYLGSAETSVASVQVDQQSNALAVINNRDVLVADDADLRMIRKFQTEPAAIRFLPSSRLAVLEGDDRLVVYDWAAAVPRPSLTDGTQEATRSGAARVGPLHKGTCGNALLAAGDETTTVRLPDGSSLTYGLKSAGDGTRYDFIAVGTGSDRTIERDPADEGCLLFSPDWKRVLVQGETTRVYDFEKMRQTGRMAGAELGSIAGDFSSVFFLGDTVVTSSGRVVDRWRPLPGGKWSREALVKGDRPITYAEPDAAGRTLLILEDTGGSMIRGALYSLAARQKWMDLGGSYKWFSVTFSDDQRIATGHGEFERLLRLPTLSELRREAVRVLAPGCRPADGEDYRTSRCWPAWLEQAG